MEINLRHNPAFAVARLFLAPNEPIKVQSGAMMAHSPGMAVDAKMEGGFLQGLKRSMLSGESFFTTTMTGAIQSRLANDVAGVRNVLTDTATSILQNGVTVTAAFISMEIQPSYPVAARARMTSAASAASAGAGSSAGSLRWTWLIRPSPCAASAAVWPR